MEDIAQKGQRRKVYVGIDVHLRTYAISVLEEGRELRKWTMPANPELLAGTLGRDYKGAEILTVYEAGFSGFVLHRELQKAGIQNIVVHAAAVVQLETRALR